jgi:hypothetical protein
LRDAELVMRLSKHNNSEVLDALKAISELTGLDFERVCRTGISTWWAAIFDNLTRNGECESQRVDSFDWNGEKYLNSNTLEELSSNQRRGFIMTWL